MHVNTFKSNGWSYRIALFFLIQIIFLIKFGPVLLLKYERQKVMSLLSEVYVDITQI